MFSLRNIVILLIIAGVGGIVFLSLRNGRAPIISPNPSPTEDSDVVTIQSDLTINEANEVRSPDGKMKLIMEATKDGDNTNYSFLVSGIEDSAVKKEIFSKTVLSGTRLDMSPNAWSPDNKYLFITEKNANSVDYFVFRADGEYILGEQQYIDVVPKFVARNTGYELSEVTGWDSETLLHVYTKKEDGSKGPSFWFEIPSQAIIQLSSR